MEEKRMRFIIQEEEAGRSLEKYLKKALPSFPLSLIYKLMRTGKVRMNDVKPKGKERLKTGDSVLLLVPQDLLPEVKKHKKPIPFKKTFPLAPYILYENEKILVLNKPEGIPVHIGSKHHGDSLIDALLGYLPPKPDNQFRPSFAHRLDMDTSGVLVAGKTLTALQEVTDYFREKEHIQKSYVALVHGHLEPKEGSFTFPLLTEDQGKKKTRVDAAGKPAITHYKVLHYPTPDLTYVSLTPLTGRTHQLRVHLAHAGYPIVGDDRYGIREKDLIFKKANRYIRLFLHAEKLTFKKPLKSTKEREFVAPVPKTFLRFTS